MKISKMLKKQPTALYQQVDFSAVVIILLLIYGKFTL